VVWQEIMRLLEDPSLLQAELDRRLQAAQTTDPLKRREEALRRDQARLTKSMERLLTVCSQRPAIAAPFLDANLRPRATSGSSLNALHITRTLASLMKTSVERYSTDGTV